MSKTTEITLASELEDPAPARERIPRADNELLIAAGKKPASRHPLLPLGKGAARYFRR
jgi:hypothetical protein